MAQFKIKKKNQTKKVTTNNKLDKAKADVIICAGEVIEVLPNTRFKVKLLKFGNDAISEEIIIEAIIAGKIRQHFIRVLAGDYVTVELSPYNLSLGRITYRYLRPKVNHPIDI